MTSYEKALLENIRRGFNYLDDHVHSGDLPWDEKLIDCVNHLDTLIQLLEYEQQKGPSV